MNAIDKVYEKQVRKFRKHLDVEKLAYEFKKYYEFYGNTTANVNQVLNSILESETCYSKKEKNVLLHDCMLLLKLRYDIQIISTNPLRMKKMM